MNFENYSLPYAANELYTQRVAYFSMEFAIHQPLKIYSGGLGFLAGSHMRSAYELKQNLIGIGILWKYGYYDQARNQDQTLLATWYEKNYYFLEETGIKFQISIHNSPVWVKAMYLSPYVFRSAPVFFLTTDLPENDYVSQTICHKLYDANEATKIAQFILLGLGGAKLLDLLNYNADFYHLNEAHAASSIFHLYKKLGSKEAVKEKLVFTTHTPEEAGNEKHDIYLCEQMGYFNGIPLDEVREITGMDGDLLNHSLVALRFAKRANGVSKLHGEVSRKMWAPYEGICEIYSITNAQNYNYWSDKKLYNAMEEGDDDAFDERKRYLQKRSFENVSDQCGKIYNPDICTIVWARRFAGYKRPDILTWDMARLEALLSSVKYPIQIIWAGKPYPMDYAAISTFNNLVILSKKYKNLAVLTGYELNLSKRLKQCADVWLNTPRVPREASGTSGMTAAMSGAVNFSTFDGWICEFAKHSQNSFIVPPVEYDKMRQTEQDAYDMNQLFDILEKEILPTFYDQPAKWREITQQGMKDVRYQFESKRMADEYYKIMYR
ncbi:MAG: alpha-glucan family phosphorylase [Saprospiraceae bacterium]|jgi:starch phosphorylase|nr:alpha-glucan family phosphorylase [Saprospiraceae bacterium]MBK7436843.1 alpha-glucan family phosphorylase [Saprospiraceae bacterium]MBK8280421.1 alpha-glucan family phosphorylase [Saprospiraceae bacterium]MBP7923817.1 alpha-glucan family phosphorylase [Saprospiraceae bacterium]